MTELSGDSVPPTERGYWHGPAGERVPLCEHNNPIDICTVCVGGVLSRRAEGAGIAPPFTERERIVLERNVRLRMERDEARALLRQVRPIVAFHRAVVDAADRRSWFARLRARIIGRSEAADSGSSEAQQ